MADHDPPPSADERRGARLRALGLEGASAVERTDALLDLVAGLRASELRLNDFSRASGDWLWETDATLTITWLSDSFAESTGEPLARHLGSNLAHARLFDAGPDNTPAVVAALLRQRAPLTRVLTLLARRAASSRSRTARCRCSTTPAASPATAAPRAT